MKNILLINADLYKSDATEHLMSAYAQGAMDKGGHHVKHLAIADLLFNFNRQFDFSTHAKLESDLVVAWNLMHWSHHLVVFCPVFASHIPSKVSGFFERLFNQPDPAIHYHTRKSLNGRSARIISVLDDALFQKWQSDKQTSFVSLRKEEFRRMHISPVHTATIGFLRALDNSYSNKWVHKLQTFGEKGI